MSQKNTVETIAYIHTNYTERKGTPPQGYESEKSFGCIELLPEFADGIRDLKAGDRIVVLFIFHLSKGYTLITKARRSSVPLGVFSTRSPDRPNSLGISTVTITEINGRVIRFEGADMLDGTPVVDIKPSLQHFSGLE